jgi:uncharacterized C2H2 Zn-finger protein
MSSLKEVNMELRWHKLVPRCPKCDDELVITDFSFSADGEILLEMGCAECGTAFQMLTTTTKLISRAMYQDIREAMQIAHDVKEEIAKPATDPTNDDNWLHDLGIGGE